MKMRELINLVTEMTAPGASEDAGWEQMKADPEGAQLLAQPKIFSQKQELTQRDLGNGQIQELLKTSFIYSMTPTSTKHVVDVISDATDTNEVITSAYHKIPGTTA